MEQEQKKQVFDNKYDRQIRLWGSNGQKRIQNSKLLLLNCEPSGVETMKNLVLPGIGNITVVDNAQVNLKDLGKNFFVSESDLGKNRGQAVFDNLLEMNPDVKGDFKNEDPVEMAQNEEFIKQFSCVIASELWDHHLKKLSQICEKYNITLIIINTYGLIGRIRLQNGIHTIIESKPLQAQYYDLKITKPWKELQNFVDSFDIEALNQKIDPKVMDGESGKAIDQLMHIPYLVILIKSLDIYRKQNAGKDPKTFAEKKAYKNIIKEMGNKLDQAENFQQAESFSYQAYIQPGDLPTSVNGGLKTIFQHEKFQNGQESFWFLARALKQFYEKYGTLPVSSNLPDMESKTDLYQQLKKIFQQKFEEDLKLFKEILGSTDISDDEIKLYIQHVCYLSVVDYRPYYKELENPLNLEIEVNYNEMGEIIINNCYQWIIGLRALNIYFERNNQYPIYQKDEQVLYDIAEDLRVNYFKLEGENSQEKIDKKITDELVRYSNSKLHNIASILAGIASQETIKLVTHQFQPFNNTFIYEGNFCKAQTLQL
ncbi:Molybdenum cofactor biosynthesis, MoeB [Pseudocohnilembus persalinus]|uniref:NEDD8-activating enzyme E1 regulatory subunit n=1 Tax=Pseudocohnilembus persalinus TaxID=266149 RepID=A0A0V0QX23_PSEPJ|nr:Molybdenum cofactor biosynthesis, MoeB [Pseudocohnilembus persalinus]|eukprot:KRX06740.1 Molybdenum cofactor biosynthesis, MoeB [Pseudocohnilembus persalinus]